jgi:DNA polymerase III epsilon subunit-like protein
MKVLIFDVETTGLPERGASLKNLTKYPYIVQFSWMIYDASQNRVDGVNDHIVKIPEHITIPIEASNVHGISNDKMRSEGKDINLVLDIFTKDMLDSHVIVAHNLSFDKTIVQAEYLRNKRINWLGRHRKMEYCTMRRSLNICNIYKKNMYTGEKTKKYPKLMELHHYWFKTVPNNLHNSLIDIFVCFRCYHQMEYNYDIMDKHKELSNYYNQICAL